MLKYPPTLKKKIQNYEGSTIVQAFKGYSSMLDAINDRYEFLVKLSRDITIGSKRLISLLQRSAGEDKDQIMKKATVDLEKIKETIHKVIHELEGQEYWRYQRAFSPGLQEFIEAVSFMQYLKDGTLINIDGILKIITPTRGEETTLGNFHIDYYDYFSGIADLTGELMRYCTNSVGYGDVSSCFHVLDFMRAVYLGFEGLPNAFLYKSKIEVMETSVKKVENVCFSLVVRGSEYPGELLGLGLGTAVNDLNLRDDDISQNSATY